MLPLLQHWRTNQFNWMLYFIQFFQLQFQIELLFIEKYANTVMIRKVVSMLFHFQGSSVASFPQVCMVQATWRISDIPCSLLRVALELFWKKIMLNTRLAVAIFTSSNVRGPCDQLCKLFLPQIPRRSDTNVGKTTGYNIRINAEAT